MIKVQWNQIFQPTLRSQRCVIRLATAMRQKFYHLSYKLCKFSCEEYRFSMKKSQHGESSGKKNLLRKIIHVLFCLKRLISEKFPFHPRITHLCSIGNRNCAMCKLFPGLYIVYYYSITTVDKLRRISKATFISDGFRTSSLLKKKIL